MQHRPFCGGHKDGLSHGPTSKEILKEINGTQMSHASFITRRKCHPLPLSFLRKCAIHAGTDGIGLYTRW